MHAPQIIYLLLLGLGLGFTLANHGKSKGGTYNIYTSLITSGLFLLLLRWGGFFG